MADAIPLKFDFDGVTPSSLSEFTSSDTVSVSNGGTGVTTLSDFGWSLSSTNVSAASVSATSITSPMVTATSVSATSVTSPTITGASVSATAVSGITFNGMPYPPPFGYMQLNSDDVASVDEKKLGYSNTPGTIVSDGITWDDTNKYFVAAEAGTYEVLAVVILEGGSTLVNLSIQKNGSDVLVGQPRVHSTVDPLEHTMRAVFTMTAGQNANVTYDATASNSVKAITGSTMTIKRLL